MSKKTVHFLIAAMLCLTTISSSAQEKLKPKDLPETHKNWLTKEVRYIITSVERDIFLMLQTSRERDRFIEAFWKQRDPTPGTELNEFRSEHYKRFNHVNRRFISAGKEGWQTDRGKIYIILGEPMEVRQFNGSDAYYPAESWYYQSMLEHGLPQAFHLLFYQKNRIGDYIIYNPGMEGPWSLLSSYRGNPGEYMESYYRLDEIEPELASLSISLIPGQSSQQFPSLASAAFLNSIDMVAINKIKDQYARKFMQYKDIVEVEYSANYMESEAEVKILQDADGVSHVHFSIEPKNLSMSSYEGSIYTNLDFSGMVTDPSGRTIYQFDRQIPLRFTEDEFQRMRTRPFSFTEAFPLISGEYLFSLLLKNSISKEFTSFETNIRIPEESPSPKIGQILLGFNAVRPSQSEAPGSPYVIDEIQLYSQGRKSFVRQDSLYTVFQLVNLRPEVLTKGSIQYIFFKEDEEFSRESFPLSKYQGRSNIMDMFPLKTFPPGYYKIKVSVLDGGQTEILSQQENFEISPVSTIPRPWVMAKYMIDPEKRNADFILGTEYLNAEDIERALPLLERAYRANPNNGDFGLRFAQAKFRQGQFVETLNILVPLSESIEDNYDLNNLMAGSYQASGDYAKAIRVYQATIDRFGVNTSLLNALGDCYAELGNKTEALAALEKSLEIDGTQDTVKAKITELKK